MIMWREQEPDFRRLPLEKFLPELSFTLACGLLVHHRHMPGVIVARSVREAVWAHLTGSTVENGGLLLGRVFAFEDDGQEFVVAVDDYAPAEEFNATPVSLHMGSRVWELARAKLQDRLSVIGWYHSHPNLGAFFSCTDRRTQRCFFAQSYCLGLVVDPFRKEEKWFLGPDCTQLGLGRIIQFD